MSVVDERLRALGKQLASEQDALVWQDSARPSFRARHRARPKRAAWLLVAATLFISIGAVVAVVAFRMRPLDLTVGGEPGVGGHWISAPSDASVPIVFSDRTEIVLYPDTHARIIDVTARGAHIMLESGTAHVSVTPKHGGQWIFSAGPFTVEVKGTRFDIDWNQEGQLFRLTLAEGQVTISGQTLCGSRALFAGETLVASCRTNDFRITRTASEDGLGATPSKPSPSVAPSSEPAPLASADRALASAPVASRRQADAPGDTWQSLARASKFKEAFARANDKGFDTELRKADVDDLLLLGDAARLSGNSGHAVRAYESVRARAPGTDAAASAAFSVGRVYFDQRDAYVEAARWFATYLNERSDGRLAREALGRQMEALSRAGDRAGAARAAEQYLRRYPSGPHAPLARTLQTEIK